MITAITLENFKGIRDRVRIELKPITLLFGANSAGKSTILQAIHYAREVLQYQNLDADQTIQGGDNIDLGGFRNLVSDRDLKKKIHLRFEMDLSREDLPLYHSLSKWDFDISPKVKSAWVEIVIGWDEVKKYPYITSYLVGMNGEGIAGIYSQGLENIIKVNVSHPIFYDDPKVDQSVGLETKVAEFTLIYPNSVLPRWKTVIGFVERNATLSEDLADNYYLSGMYLSWTINQILRGTGEVLTEKLNKFLYLGPIREIPPRNYQPVSTKNRQNWANGLAAWDTLYLKDQIFLEKVNYWLGEEKLKTGYALKMKVYKEVDLESPIITIIKRGAELDDIEILKAYMEKLPNKKRLFLFENKTGIEVFPQDIGIGISQVIPVIVIALNKTDDCIIAIEQPELHIHPAIQTELGDLFIDQINEKEVTFLLETHSEHLILRMLRRIRETNDNELPPDAPALTSDKVSVIYVEQTAEGVKLTPLRIDETGEFIDRWPKGFFEERAEELF